MLFFRFILHSKMSDLTVGLRIVRNTITIQNYDAVLGEITVDFSNLMHEVIRTRAKTEAAGEILRYIKNYILQTTI